MVKVKIGQPIAIVSSRGYVGRRVRPKKSILYLALIISGPWGVRLIVVNQGHVKIGLPETGKLKDVIVRLEERVSTRGRRFNLA
ncbi:hypothetical protein MAR_029779 [Mya arenaria]|uniref:Uncharacterized protein n=1 Tax=Mya arenaria TaxID=6604 RepID=A0ABY7DIG1_MYAAR|nr:hypothetical protein MAR_029779 [Mya arenaria]